MATYLDFGLVFVLALGLILLVAPLPQRVVAWTRELAAAGIWVAAMVLINRHADVASNIVVQNYSYLIFASAVLLGAGMTWMLFRAPQRFRATALRLGATAGVGLVALLAFKAGLSRAQNAYADVVTAGGAASAQTAIEATMRPFDQAAIAVLALAAYLFAIWVMRAAYTTPDFADAIREPNPKRTNSSGPRAPSESGA